MLGWRWDMRQIMTERNEVRLAKLAIENLPLPRSGKRFERWWVNNVPGLCIRVMETGVKSFLFVRRIGHRTTEITLGKFPALTPDQAKRMVMEMNAQASNGIDPADEIRAHRKELTLGEGFGLYLERHAKPHKRTWQEDERRWKLYLEAGLAKQKLSDISRRDISNLHTQIGQVGRQGHGSPYEANRVLALISVVYSKLHEWEITEKNPVTGIKKFREEKRDRFLKSGELPHFFKALAEINHDYASDFFLLLLLTGARKTNVLEMTWNDIDFKEATWRIPRTKNDDPQTVILVPQAITILRQRKAAASSAWVFPSDTSASGHLEEPKKAWRNLRALVTCYRLIDLLKEKLKWTIDYVKEQEVLSAMHPQTMLSQLTKQAESINIEPNIHKDLKGRLVGDDNLTCNCFLLWRN